MKKIISEALTGNDLWTSMCPFESGFIAVSDHGSMIRWQPESGLTVIPTGTKEQLRSVCSLKFPTRIVAVGDRGRVIEWKPGFEKAMMVNLRTDVCLHSVCPFKNGIITVGSNGTFIYWQPESARGKTNPLEKKIAINTLFSVCFIETGVVALSCEGNLIYWQPALEPFQIDDLKIRPLFIYSLGTSIVAIKNHELIIQWQPGSEPRIIPTQSFDWPCTVCATKSGFFLVGDKGQILQQHNGIISSETLPIDKYLHSVHSYKEGFIGANNDFVIEKQKDKIKIILIEHDDSLYKTQRGHCHLSCLVGLNLVVVTGKEIFRTSFPWGIRDHKYCNDDQRNRIRSVFLSIKSSLKFHVFLSIMDFI